MRQFRFSVDHAFNRVIAACGDVRRPSGWIDQYVIDAFTRLHRLGIAHSVEVWHGNDLVGGLYGVDVGGVFAGESMFHEMTDASKAALVVLDRLMNDGTGRLIDTQWMTDHLFSMGAVQIDRRDYIAILEQLRDKSALDWTARASTIGINVTK
jgi:leucyl/phenylalanyl-tRNA--protein transferase